jgi:hypothetical protein
MERETYVVADGLVVKVGLKIDRATALPSADQASTELLRVRSQDVRSINEELVPVLNVLSELADAEKTAIDHPRVACGSITRATAEDHALFDSVLAWRSEGFFFCKARQATYDWLRDAVFVAEAVCLVR